MSWISLTIQGLTYGYICKRYHDVFSQEGCKTTSTHILYFHLIRNYERTGLDDSSITEQLSLRSSSEFYGNLQGVKGLTLAY